MGGSLLIFILIILFKVVINTELHTATTPKMTPAQRYADYPRAQEASYISYKTEEDKNPALRGLPLAIGAAM